MSPRRARASPEERPRFTDPADYPAFSGYQSVWLFAMFDMPVVTKAQKRAAARFRKNLLARGFSMLQYSVYARYCTSEEFAKGVKCDLRGVLPDEGQVRLVMVTDRQFGKMEVYYGKRRSPTEEPPPQLMLF